MSLKARGPVIMNHRVVAMDLVEVAVWQLKMMGPGTKPMGITYVCVCGRVLAIKTFIDNTTKKQFSTEDNKFVVIVLITAVGIACYSDGCICHDRVCPSVRLSVCLSVCLSVLRHVTFRCYVETNEATIMRFSPTSMAIILVSGEVKVVWKFARDHP